MKIKTITLLLLFLSTTLFAQKDWKTLEKDEYAISYPEDWESSNKKPQPTMEFLLLSDENTQKEDLFRENINLTTEDLGDRELTVEAYTTISIDQIVAQIPTAKVGSSQSITIDGREAKSIVWSADFGNGMILKFKQVLIIYSGKAYILTFSSSEAEFNIYIEVGDQILNSFKLAK